MLRRRDIFLDILLDQRPLLVLGQTEAGKTTLIKRLMGKYAMPSIIFDYNDEYYIDNGSIREEIISEEEALNFLHLYLAMLSDMSAPQELLLLLILQHGQNVFEAIERVHSLKLYDLRVVNAVKLRLDAFKLLIENFNRYTVPVVKFSHIPPILRIPFTVFVLAHRLLKRSREILVLEEAQSLNINFIAEEGRKYNKKLIFVTNDIEKIPPSVRRNSIVLLLHGHPEIKYYFGYTEPYINPVSYTHLTLPTTERV